MEGASNDLLVFGLDLSASKARIRLQIQQIVKEVSGNSVQVTASLNVPESQKIIQSQLNSITKNLNVNVNANVDTNQFKQQAENLSKEASASVNNSFSAIQNGANKVNLSGLSQQFKQVQTQTKTTDTTSQEFFSNLTSGLKSSITQMLKFQLAYKIIKTTEQAIKAMVQSVIELDGVLTEFNKVADLSADELSKFADKAYASATEIGRTGKDMIEASTEFKKAGNSLDETIGMLTGGFTQLRNMEKVSSGLITISQRLRAVDEDGEAIDGLSAELESAFGSIGVALRMLTEI